MDQRLYNGSAWRQARAAALERDGHTCTVAAWFGGLCAGPLHVHHLRRPEHGGAPYDLSNLGTVCARHHPSWEKLRRAFEAGEQATVAHCGHDHRTRAAREQCERRMARRRGLVAA